MKISRTLTHHMSMGDYEHIEVCASVEVDSDAVPGMTLPALLSYFERAGELLHAALADDLAKAAKATCNPRSYLFTYTQEGPGL